MPAMFPANGWLFDAFMALDTCRAVGMAMGPIPWVAADCYARRLELDDEDFAVMWSVLHRADTAYRAELSSKDG